MHFNSLRHLLKGFQADLPKPPPPRTAPSEKGKVVSIPTRTPVNRQALRVILSNPDWLSRPKPETQERPTRAAFDALAARLKTEFNEHADTREKLGAANSKIRDLTDENRKLSRKVSSMEGTIMELESTVRQLEDLKL